MTTIYSQETIQAFAAQKPSSPLSPFEYQREAMGPFDVEVEITHCGICHSDLHLLDNEWKITSYPFVPGHEIIGRIIQKGDAVLDLPLGLRVGIGWQRSSCHHCEWCHLGQENVCEKKTATCVGHFGGFARKILADSRFVFPIPEDLPSHYAAPLLCGGATVFSPLVDHQISATKRVAVVSIGGLGHLALQFAKAFGAQVSAISSTKSKKEEAFSFGADHFYTFEDLEKLKRSFDLVLFTGSHPLSWGPLIETLRPNGAFCLLGAPSQPITFPAIALIDKKARVSGSNIANPSTMRAMLNCAARHKVYPQVELFHMHEVNNALEKLRAGQIRYRAVLSWEP